MRLVLKQVCYGPAQSGKGTNLLRLHYLLNQDGRLEAGWIVCHFCGESLSRME